MSEYTDTTLINCNRSASVEARSDNNQNPAVFKNPLQQTLKLNVGDKVSVERAFISEVGAGNPSTIEFKGENKGRSTLPTYTVMTPTFFDTYKEKTYNANYRLGGFRVMTTTEVSDDTADLRDNFAPMIIGYYITSNEYPNYIQQPRRFAQSNDTRDTNALYEQTFYTDKDSTTDGFCDHTIDEQCFVRDDWTKRVGGAAGTTIYKQKVKNERYTMFIKDSIVYAIGRNAQDQAKLVPIALKQFPTKTINGVFSEATYYRIRERLDLSVSKGFNTPSAIAEQLTEQLTDTKPPSVFSILDGDGYERKITKILESATYKPINAQNYYNYNSTTFGEFRANLTNGANITQNRVDYISQFGYIAVKRPEIFEAGRLMGNTIRPAATVTTEANRGTGFLADGFEGFQIFNTLPNSTPPLRRGTEVILNVEYTEANLKIIREFFDTQRLYPELWSSLENTEDYSIEALEQGGYFNVFPTKENSRFFNMNKYTSNMTGGAAERQFTFGNDDFTHAGAGAGTANKASGALFFSYDDKQRDFFIEGQNYEPENGLIYGFAVPHLYTDSSLGKRYLIKIRPAPVGGIPKSFYTNTTVVFGENVVENGRRIGFDFHASAYSTCIITPYSGYGKTDIGTTVTQGPNSDIDNLPSTTPNLRDTVTAANATDLSPYYTMCYMGANNPLIDYNNINNRFEIKRLHNANNVGNELRAGTQKEEINSGTMFKPVSKAQIKIIPAPINQAAGGTVYKINPRPPQFGYSPTFKPYAMYNAAFRAGVYSGTPDEVKASSDSNLQLYSPQNINIEPYEIFDSHGGIYIEDWGYSKDDWADNMWDILGYDYDSVNAEPTEANVLNQRIDNSNRNILYRPTTNAEIVSTDSKVYIANEFNAKQYYTSLPYPNNISNWTVTTVGGKEVFEYPNPIGQPLSVYPEIVVETESLSIRAKDLQKSVLKPYYSIRSSILEGYSAIGGNPTGANLPIAAIIDKYSAQGDFFTGNSDLQFTITKPTVLSDITTSIHDPDGEYSNVDLNSAVIYKVSKIRTTPTGIIEQIIEDTNPKKNPKK